LNAHAIKNIQQIIKLRAPLNLQMSSILSDCERL